MEIAITKHVPTACKICVTPHAWESFLRRKHQKKTPVAVCIINYSPILNVIFSVDISDCVESILSPLATTYNTSRTYFYTRRLLIITRQAVSLWASIFTIYQLPFTMTRFLNKGTCDRQEDLKVDMARCLWLICSGLFLFYAAVASG